LQQAVNSFTLSNPLVVDGEWGPKTVAATNACNPLTLVAAFQQQRVAYYQAIVAANPSKAKFLAAWIARAQK
jgi:type VI secretion system secreted protein VgrG